MINKKIGTRFLISKNSLLFFIIIAMVSLLQLHKLNVTLTKRTLDGDSVYSENNIISDASLIYVDENIFIVFSESDNTIQYYTRSGEFSHSLSLSSYSSIDITYNSINREFYGYYYRSQNWFTISEDGYIWITEESTFNGEISKTSCFEFDSEEYCISKNIFGESLISNSNNNIIVLESNSIHYKASVIIVLVGFPIVLYVLVKKPKLWEVFNIQLPGDWIVMEFKQGLPVVSYPIKTGNL